MSGHVMIKARKKHQEGAFLVMIILMLVVLLGFAALVIDVGRLLILRTEMQHAVDAAALAAAVELDQSDQAIVNAKKAARIAITDTSHFARVQALLGDAALPDDAFTFYCVIGTNSDIPDDAPGFTDF